MWCVILFSRAVWNIFFLFTCVIIQLHEDDDDRVVAATFYLGFLLFLLLLDLLLLVEDLLGLSVADQESHGHQDQEEGDPADTITETKAPGTDLSWRKGETRTEEKEMKIK